MKSFLILCFSLLALTAFTQTEYKNFDEAQKALKKDFDIDVLQNGIIVADFGSACAGRYLFNLRDVTLGQKVKPSANCGAEKAVKSVVISFECNTDNCILDPAMLSFEQGKSGTVVFENMKKGFEFYRLLVQLQAFLE